MIKARAEQLWPGEHSRLAIHLRNALLLTLLLTGMPVVVLAQSPAPTPSSTVDQHTHAEARSETQPPEQSGQAQQLMKEARIELERAALDLEVAGTSDLTHAVLTSREALVQFEQSL
jgi:hypothetical protein